MNQTHPALPSITSSTTTNNISRAKHTKPSTKDQAKHIATPIGTIAGTFAAKQQFLNLQNHPHNHRRLQPRLPKQVAEARVLSSG
jgi:hypothetical protein